MKSLLISSYALNCTAAMSLGAELETKESEGLTSDTQLVPLTSKAFAPAFDLLLRAREDRGPLHSLLALLLLFTADLLLLGGLFQLCSQLCTHKSLSSFTSHCSECLGLCHGWGRAENLHSEPLKSLQRSGISHWAVFMATEPEKWLVLTAACHYPCLKWAPRESFI